jgi:hypothetical protein
MVVVGVDPHKRTHTAVAVGGIGQQLAQITVGNAAGAGAFAVVVATVQ